MRIFYRISDGSYKKERFPRATKKNCLENFLVHFPVEEITVLADNVTDDTFEWLQSYNFDLRRTNGGSSAAGFRLAFDEAITLPKDEIVYFVEDDYFHLSGSRAGIIEALNVVHYVTLYDHPDKYIPAHLGGNPLIGEDAAESTLVFLTKSRHWKLTNSTTMTFATTVQTLQEDEPVWRKYTTGKHPHDFDCFIELRKNERSLASPIPTLSTHCETAWAAPLFDWNTI